MMSKCIPQVIAAGVLALCTIPATAGPLAQLEAFNAAVEIGDVAQVRAFLQQEPRLATARTADHWPVFLQQAMLFSPEILALFLKHGADPNVRNDAGDTLLHNLADPQAIRLLLAAGADIEARNHLGWTPLMRHATDETTGPDAVYTLLAEGANPAAKGKRGETAASLLPPGPRFDAIKRAMRRQN